jgi:hypothetical protein
MIIIKNFIINYFTIIIMMQIIVSFNFKVIIMDFKFFIIILEIIIINLIDLITKRIIIHFALILVIH